MSSIYCRKPKCHRTSRGERDAQGRPLCDQHARMEEEEGRQLLLLSASLLHTHLEPDAIPAYLHPGYSLGCPYDCYRHSILNAELRLIPARVYRKENGEILPCPLHTPKEVPE